jgi:hypothetical protein
LKRPETPQPGRSEGIDRARDQGRLWTDQRQVDALRARELEEPRDVLGRDADVAHLGLAGGAGVAGSDQHFRDARRGGALPGESVLAAAAADDEDLHFGADPVL